MKGVTITSGGHGFSGIARRTLLQILAGRATDLGVNLRFRTELPSNGNTAGVGIGEYDLLVAADGVNSAIRKRYAEHFRPEVDTRHAKYIWLGTQRLFDAFTFAFVENECGVFQAHAYRFDERQSAFIVECDERSWRAAGFDRMNTDESIAACERLFAEWLDGHDFGARRAERVDQAAQVWQHHIAYLHIEIGQALRDLRVPYIVLRVDEQQAGALRLE